MPWACSVLSGAVSQSAGLLGLCLGALDAAVIIVRLRAAYEPGKHPKTASSHVAPPKVTPGARIVSCSTRTRSRAAVLGAALAVGAASQSHRRDGDDDCPEQSAGVALTTEPRYGAQRAAPVHGERDTGMRDANSMGLPGVLVQIIHGAKRGVSRR